MTTITEVQRPLTATHERQLRQSAKLDRERSQSNPIQESSGKRPSNTVSSGNTLNGQPGNDPPSDHNSSCPSSHQGPYQGPEENDCQGPSGGPPGPPSNPGDDLNPDKGNDQDFDPEEILNQDLTRAILALSKSKGKDSLTKKAPYKSHEPDTFDGSMP